MVEAGRDGMAVMPQARVQPVAVRPAEVTGCEPVPVPPVQRRRVMAVPPVGLMMAGHRVPRRGAATPERQSRRDRHGERGRTAQEAPPRHGRVMAHECPPLRGWGRGDVEPAAVPPADVPSAAGRPSRAIHL
jgi:hypothetical protein